MRTFDKYKQNLKTSIKPLGWWSMTTTKHINYVGSEYGYEVQKVK